MNTRFNFPANFLFILLIFLGFSLSASGQTTADGETLYEDAVCVDTNVGEFCMELFPNDAPATVDNFLGYVNSGRYDDTIIHRTVPGFVIQGGGYSSDPLGSEISKDPVVQNEYNRSNLRSTVAMARLGGVPNSATSEWFVNLGNNSQLDSVDGGFTVFGEIITGMSVVDNIGTLARLDLRSALGGAFGEVPRSRAVGSGGVVAEDLVIVFRIYVTDVIVGGDSGGGDSGGGDSGGGTDNGTQTTVTYTPAARGFSMPVRVDGKLYRIAMLLDSDSPGATFKANTKTIIELVDSGQDAANMDLVTGMLSIPSVTVGNKVFLDVVFSLTDFSTLTFKLASFNRE